MYRCRECGREFYEPHRYVETHGFTDGLYEEWAECPYCCSPDFALEFEWDDYPDEFYPEEVISN